jgi:hypothetical protein
MSSIAKRLSILELEKAKLILADHISDNGKRQAFLAGVGVESCVISNLDFSLINGYNFNDFDAYTFENCSLKDTQLSFEKGTIIFDHCTFKETINILHNGTKNTDSVIIKNTYPSKSFFGITIESPKVIFENSRLYCRNHINVKCNIGNFDYSSIRAHIVRLNCNAFGYVKDFV